LTYFLIKYGSNTNMRSKYLPIEEILTILKETPPRLAKLTVEVDVGSIA